MKAWGVGASLTTTASPPISARASRVRPVFRRSAKKPTAVSAATASVTATISRRSSPARRSRQSVRHPSCQAEFMRLKATVLSLAAHERLLGRCVQPLLKLAQHRADLCAHLDLRVGKAARLAGLLLALADHRHRGGEGLLEG